MNENIKETKDGKFLAVAAEIFPLPSSGGYDRLHRNWRKTVTGLDKSKTDGYSLVGEFINDGPKWFHPGLYLACAWRGSVKNQSPYYALYYLSVDGEIETIADVDGGKDWAIKLWPVIQEKLATKPDLRQAALAEVKKMIQEFSFSADEIGF